MTDQMNQAWAKQVDWSPTAQPVWRDPSEHAVRIHPRFKAAEQLLRAEELRGQTRGIRLDAQEVRAACEHTRKEVERCRDRRRKR